MSEYANKFINEEGATVWAVGIQTSTKVLDSMVLDKNKYCYQIYNNVGLNSLLSEIKKEIVTEEEQKVVSVDGKVLLQNINEISASKPITIKLSGLVNQEIQVTSVASSGGLIEEISDEYWLVLERLASRVGGIEALDYSTIEILY